MSQAKVDKYKKEKKNRAKNVKRKRAKKIAGILVLYLLIASAIGYPLGRQLYKVSVEHRKANATIDSGLYQYWIQEYWNTTYGVYWDSDDDLATETDAATETDSDAETETDATATDASTAETEPETDAE